MLNNGNIIKTGEITGIFSARTICNIRGFILITRHAERFLIPDTEIRTIFNKKNSWENVSLLANLKFLISLLIQGSKRLTKYLANGIIRYTSSETEGLTTEMSTAMKAMPGTRRD